MSSSKIGGGKPSRSASTIVTNIERGYHILKIDGYSLTKNTTPTGKYLESSSFTVGGHRWRLYYFPNGDSDETDNYISIYIVLQGTAAKHQLVDVQYQLRFAGEVEKDPAELDQRDSFPSESAVEYSKFIKREDLEKSEHLKDDSFAVRCDIGIIKQFGVKDTPATFVTVPPSDMHQHLADLLHTGRGADVVFHVGGTTIAAHRWMLAARSPVFNAELFGMMKESNAGGVVNIEDMECQVFKAFLYFVYTDSFPDMSKEDGENVMAQHLLVAADRYNMERLKLICEEKLCQYIDVGSVATILTLAEQHHCHGLKEACFHFLSSPENRRAFVASEGFEHLTTSCPSITKELILK